MLAAFAFAPLIGHAAPFPALLDDFSNAEHTLQGAPRFVVDDKTAGGQSQATQKCEQGILSVHGELVPGRGQPAFISVPLLLSPDGQPHDLTGYEGVRLRIKVVRGMLAVQVSSTEIQNYDYHTSAPIAGKDGGFQEVRLRFADLKRGWSEPVALNLKSITSVNLVAFGLARGDFAYEIDEIGFY